MKEERSATLKLSASMLIFGTIGIFRRYIPMPSSSLAMFRGIIGTFFLLAFIYLSGKKISFTEIKKQLFYLVLSGAMIGINWLLLFESYNHTTVAIATICYYMAPVFVIIVSPFILKERLTMIKLFCVTASVAGMLMVSGVFDKNEGSTDILGIVFGLGAAVFYASVILLNQKLKEVPAYDKTIVQLISAAAVMLPYVLLAESEPLGEISFFSVSMVLVVGILNTGIAYALYFGSMKALPAQKIALFSYIDPIIAVLLSAFLIKETPSLLEITGIVLVLCATAVYQFMA